MCCSKSVSTLAEGIHSNIHGHTDLIVGDGASTIADSIACSSWLESPWLPSSACPRSVSGSLDHLRSQVGWVGAPGPLRCSLVVCFACLPLPACHHRVARKSSDTRHRSMASWLPMLRRIFVPWGPLLPLRYLRSSIPTTFGVREVAHNGASEDEHLFAAA